MDKMTNELHRVRSELASEIANTVGEVLNDVLDRYTSRIFDAIRTASIAELADSAPLTIRPPTSHEKPTVAKTQQPSPATVVATTPSEVIAHAAKILDVLRVHPEGLRTDQLRDLCGLAQSDYAKAVGFARSVKALKKRGNKRGTEYRAVGDLPTFAAPQGQSTQVSATAA